MDELLSDGREFLLATPGPTFLDFHFCSMIAIVLSVPEYSGGVLSPRLVQYRCSGRCAGRGPRWRGMSPRRWSRRGRGCRPQGMEARRGQVTPLQVWPVYGHLLPEVPERQAGVVSVVLEVSR